MIKELEICKICNQLVIEPSHFYRNHHLKLENYCLQYFNRRDLLDNSSIPFKSPDSYFSCDFLNKNNLKKYLKELPKERAAEYCKSLLKRRKNQKNLIYTPSQVELISLPCFPPVHYLNTLFDYYGICQELGFVNKFKSISNDFKLDIIKPPENSQIVIDSRESCPLKFDIPVKIESLNVGDYAFSHNPYIIFERKSLADLIGSLTQGLERLTKELERADKAGIYLIMIVENKIQDALSFNHLPWMKRVKTKATPEFIFYNIRELIQRFIKFQVIFCDGRKEVTEYIMKGFLSGDTFCNYDLQLLRQLDLM